ncbi:GTP-binding protein, partial [Flavihumibacter sediminis]|nr:GTP-binding protein [Flavihumibacter sediminis]
YAAFVDNQTTIERRWDKQFGDRFNELVIIGQELNKQAVEAQLQSCLCTENEIAAMKNGQRFKDRFPV